MYPKGNMQRAPPSTSSRPSQRNLPPIRTSALQPTTQSSPAPQSSISAPPGQPYPSYPIPIPAHKIEKALRLYKIYKAARYEEELASRQLDPRSATSNHDGFYLSVPGTPTPRSTTSRTSSQRRRAESVSTSNYGGATDISSVISFDGNESPSKSKTELSTWDGKKVKPRRRQRFPKAAKAKTALVRHLGCCGPCHTRRVPCDLEQHHDIKTLETLLKSPSTGQRSVSAPQAPTYSSISGFSQQNAGSASTEQVPSGIIQTNALLGMGQNEHLQTSTPFDVTHLDIPSTFDDPIANISAPATHYYETPDLSSFASNSTPSYQNGGMFPIGIQRRGYFHCEHILCDEYFNNAEDVQLHFEMSHFPFTRITPAHRYVCASCEHMNDMPTGTCYNCGTLGRIEIRIYGNYIETRSYQRYSTDGHDLQNTSSTPYYPSAYDVPNAGLQEGPDMNGGDFNGRGFNGGTNPGNYYFQPADPFGNGPSPSNQNYGYSQYGNMGANGNQYQGQGFRHATHNFEEKTQSSRRTKTFRWQRLLFALAILSLAITFYFSYTGPFTKLRSFLVRSIAAHMPVLGFVGIVAPLAMCSIVKHFTVQRVRSAHCRPQRCPLHTLRSRPMRWMGCRPTAPDTYIRGGIHS